MEAVLDVGDGVGVCSGHFFFIFDRYYEMRMFLEKVDDLKL